MTTQAQFPSCSFTSWALAACAALALLGCEHERVSVGTLPCSDDERVLCESHAREIVTPQVVQFGAEGERAATLVWQLALPDCSGSVCTQQENDFLVHEDGEVTLAAVRNLDEMPELWVAWLDADGQALFETHIPGSSAWLGSDRVTQLALQRDADGEVLLLVGRWRVSSPDSAHGTLRALKITRSGEIEISFEIDTGKTWPDKVALLDSDVLIARGSFANNVEIARYSRRGDVQWRQTRIASVPEKHEVGVEFSAETPLELHGLAVDRLGRIWGSLSEGLHGLVQLDPDGILAWHGLIPAGILDAAVSTHIPIAIDSRDRAITGVVETVLRFEPDIKQGPRRTLGPRGSAGHQEQFWPQNVFGLGVDAQDRIYVATQDGPRSQRRMLIERISEDFADRERFVLPIGSEGVVRHQLDRIRVADNGDVYVGIVRATTVSRGGDTAGFRDVALIARVRLGE